MKLIPINNDTKTEIFNSENQDIVVRKLKESLNNDPLKIIPSAMYTIISQHRKNILVSIIFLSTIILASISIVLFFVIKLHPELFVYLFPALLFILISYKWSLLLYQYNIFNKLIARYREDIQYNLTSSPQFLDTIYVGLIKKQVIHNWITFIYMFYIGIFTLLLWWLKDQSWGFLKFRIWINNAFRDPNLITTLLTISILIFAIVYLYCSIKRKQQIYRINTFSGQKIISETDIIQTKSLLNTSWRRGFILSIIIILVIPFIIRLILKILKVRK